MLSTLAAKLLTIAIASNIGTSPDASAPGRDCVALLAPADDGPDTPASRRAQFAELTETGEKLVEKQQWKEAAEVFGRCVALAEMLYADDPKNRRSALDLIAALDCLGDIRVQLYEPSEATAPFQRALALCEKLAESDPVNADVRYRLPSVLVNLGKTLSGREPKRAAELFERAIAASEKAVAADPKDRRALRSLQLSLDALGYQRLNRGGQKEAIEIFRRSLVVAEKVAADATDREAQRDLLITLGYLGKALDWSGFKEEAEKVYPRALGIAGKLVATDPKNVRARLDLIGVYRTVAQFEWSCGQPDAAIRQYQKGLDTGSIPNAPEELAREVSYLRHLISSLRATVAVLEDPDSVVKLEESYRAPALTEAFSRLLSQKDFVKARRVAELLAERGKSTFDFYEAARMFSQLAGVADGGQREKDAARAVDMIRIAVCKGLRGGTMLRDETDFDPIRERADFKAILANLEKAPKPPSPPKK